MQTMGLVDISYQVGSYKYRNDIGDDPNQWIDNIGGQEGDHHHCDQWVFYWVVEVAYKAQDLEKCVNDWLDWVLVFDVEIGSGRVGSGLS